LVDIVTLPGGGIEDGLLCSADGFAFGWDRDIWDGPRVDTEEEVSL
jgi:hypothetical protein